MSTQKETPYLTALQRDGFVVISSLLDPAETTSFRAAATTATTKTRTGSWPHFRTVPKQFPPWPTTPPPASEGGIWGVQHLLHPEMPGRKEFARFYFSEKVLAVAEELLGLSTSTGSGSEGKGEEPLVMELFNLLVAPETKDFELRWHRDDIPDTVSPEEEERLLHAKSPAGKQSHAQYNLALCEDASLIVVPGSHRRVRTEAERSAAPYEGNMPGQLVVELKPGDAVFYDSNILHRGVYRAKPEGGEESRLTLHGSIGLKGSGGDEADKKVRATAVLQHGVGAWVHRDDAAFGIGERAEKMRANLVAMGTGEGVGYSLQG
ncbi:phytanoyl-CoA dioxygenase family protein [Aspergillus affinis]|uniref:phytanoyl-CoA dioxygenase family protein n=1 Tax=Aspergillus affinis TaxID=1070780 RepID=UPI0022FEB420|nr:phytanoyl-CoA dioxygenase family protein [Aspergillus affinis]KAI9035623.1 phytanoyl-CoA dioxygenase family protein [Aspergillus affinis]